MLDRMFGQDKYDDEHELYYHLFEEDIRIEIDDKDTETIKAILKKIIDMKRKENENDETTS